MSRTTSQASSATSTATNGLSRTASVKATTKPTSSANPIAVSDTKLFVTNLRLLDFELCSDWPNITAQTFSARNADQKQRIGGVEWALYRLFEIWDPEETAQKLRPFFPPLEPLQSLNLRAALYRSLNDLKKNGVLGRETVLRKTMLDECKGDKFYEILAVFSTAVLKKALDSQRNRNTAPAVARRLATASMLPPDTHASLLPLAIAHKAALLNVLRRKDEKRRRFAEFEALLNTKADEINRRIRKCKETPRAQRPAVPQREADAIKKQLRNNWIGNQKWLDTMLHGDDVQAEDAFLGNSFQKVWYMVERGRKVEDAAPESGLLENLQNRLQEQQARLQKWKTFHQKMNEQDKKTSVPSKSQAPVTELTFDAHLQLQLPKPNTALHEEAARAPLRDEYQDLLSEMDEELARVARSRHDQSAFTSSRRRTSSQSVSRSPVRRRMSRQSSGTKVPIVPTVSTQSPSPARRLSREKVPTRPMPRQEPVAATSLDSDATLIGRTSTTYDASATRTLESPAGPQTELPEEHHESHSYSRNRVQELSPSPGNTVALPSITSPPHLPQPTKSHTYPSPSPPSYFPSEPPALEPPDHSTEELMAEAIISSIGNATPSPIKQPQPRPSLLERTRMSMARNPSFPPITESPTPQDSPSLPEPPTISYPPPTISLLDRTRLSMAAMHTTQQPKPPHDQKKPRKSSRQSLYPVNQFDTPRTRKSIQMLEDERGFGTAAAQSTPKEDLFEDEADYDRVFKSRPRIATSPIFSPAVAEDENTPVVGREEGVTGVDLGDVDVDEDEDGFTQTLEASPSKRRGDEGAVKYRGVQEQKRIGSFNTIAF
ncbi:hypothetical protein BS50DRAFT_572478 [Corynespora cassiicola Philippines]|uniref:HAUS augmin-like complex subunit 6 N-terminal domain-containing protein n=1 Tax=Corynespora cassiicola Philippines TaxID=1448308 RepID=A0A2T2NVA4_CORCC|nr:hypothetical protein BS50DRAFT_572478 [Corynespora cassiicola Philippines]